MCEVIVSTLRQIGIWGDAAVLGKTDRWQKHKDFPSTGFVVMFSLGTVY